MLSEYNNIKIIHSDAYKPYIKYFEKLNKLGCGILHTTTKKLTTHIESFNSILRHRLACFNRRTRKYLDEAENLIKIINGFCYKHIEYLYNQLK